ncbi:MAG: DUF4105 domain-containing protein [Tannerellaceae bacterium]|jgi:hypothetical protein|nr:DUF4105 domain-containing protein [Tannerellaceae bacterium]
MKRILHTIFFILVAAPVWSQTLLSDRAIISLVTYDPSEGAVFTVYGHTAIRVSDPSNDIDLIFNYGIFDFGESDFIYRFTKGETDYKLGVVSFRHLLVECEVRGCGARELVLNLLPQERQAIWEALLLNARPENATYRYNFFFDNCATRPLLLIEKYVLGKIVYAPRGELHTFRQLINHCMRNNPWMIFGTELVLGSPADRTATPREELFLPLYLESAFAGATIVSSVGAERPLTLRCNTLAVGREPDVSRALVGPLACALIMLGLVALILFWEMYYNVYFRWVDVLLLVVGGLAGCLIFFLSFVSVHPATWPNWVILWLHPFHLIGAALVLVKRWRQGANLYHILNILCIAILLLCWPMIPQRFNIAFLPMMLCYGLRSAAALTR